MEFPICELCAKSGLLCSTCESKLSSGKITKLDIDISKLIASLSERFPLEKANVEKTIDAGSVVLLLTKGEVGALIGKQGTIVRELTNGIGKKVRIVGRSNDMHRIVSDIISPARLLGVNTVFKPDSKVYKVRISKRDLDKLPMDLPTLQNSLNVLLEAQTTVVFE